MPAFQLTRNREYSPGTVGIYAKILGVQTLIARGIVGDPDGNPDADIPRGLTRWKTQVEAWSWGPATNGFYPVGVQLDIQLTPLGPAGKATAGEGAVGPVRTFRSHEYTRSRTLVVPDARPPLAEPLTRVEAYLLKTVVPTTPTPQIAARILREVSAAVGEDGAPARTAEHWIVTEYWKFDRPHSQTLVVEQWTDRRFVGTVADLAVLGSELGMKGAGFRYHHLRPS